MMEGQLKLRRQDDVPDHLHCKFGRWYYGEAARQYSHLPAFKAIASQHEKVHTMAKQIVHAYNNGQQQQAKELYRQFIDITDTVIKLLDDLEVQINQQKKVVTV